MSCNESPWLLWCPLWISLTPARSRRENWFQVTPWIAEFWCWVSNLGFLYVAWKHQEPGIAFAGMASILSHAIPWEPFLWFDKVGVLLALGSVASRLWMKKMHWQTMVGGAISLACLNGLDYLLSPFQYLWPWPHVLWHGAAAALSFYFLELKKSNVPAFVEMQILD